MSVENEVPPQLAATPIPPRALPLRPPAEFASPEAALARKQAREDKDAQVRGVTSIEAMREAIKQAARDLPIITEVPRLGMLDAAAFRARAALGLPFLMRGLVQRWPLSKLEPDILRQQFSHLPVRARVGDYINTAFAADRAMQDMSMGQYLDLVAEGKYALPPYLGNLELRELNRLCHWPTYFDKMGPPRFWVGPAGTVTPLHCDYDDNIFAQVWGRKRIFLSPPHHDAFLYPREANAILFGSPFDPEAPDFQRFPLARQANMIECLVEPGDMLYVPAGWYHQVRALTFSLSSNRWARAVPLALHGGEIKARHSL
ncbi:transcription factor [Janthinobacterium sp. ROICE36]|uniref:cupin-like domain-containing protein n=1 Tax=Janthinobacterium sp. ROICE36 TaxID=2048670 RepID=UPI000C7F64F8|nr:cupin-like domain-containing protein [Janthinobacterium sp. ROICE36]PLY39732.1 transcription factor [Janthinobacterium sp. ROICE36]